MKNMQQMLKEKNRYLLRSDLVAVISILFSFLRTECAGIIGGANNYFQLRKFVLNHLAILKT